MTADFRMMVVHGSGEEARDYRLSSTSARFLLGHLAVPRRTADVGAVVLSEVTIASAPEARAAVRAARAASAAVTSDRYRDWYQRDCDRIAALVEWAGDGGWLVIESADID